MSTLLSCSKTEQKEEYTLTELQYASDINLNVLNEAIESDPDNAVLYYKRARYFYQTGAFKNAENDINKTLRLETSKNSYWLQSAQIHLELNQIDKALNDGLKAEQLGSKDPNLYILLAECNLEKNDKVAADNYLFKVKSIAPHLSEIPYLEGLRLLQIGDTIQAKQRIKESIQLNNDNIDSYIVLMKLYYVSKNYDSIMPLLIKAKRVRPHAAELFLYEGKFYESINRHPIAKIAYQEGILCDPNEESLYLPLSDIYAKELNYKDAMLYLTKWLDKHPNDKKAMEKLGQYSVKNNDLPGAITYYKTLYQLDTNQVSIKKEISLLQKQLLKKQDTLLIK
jgi:tetratricopeptide (TPR) repeat protein